VSAAFAASINPEDWNISLDVVQRPDELVVKASVPGVKADGIDLSIQENVLTIRAERQAGL
jgi:HSP20 family protein